MYSFHVPRMRRNCLLLAVAAIALFLFTKLIWKRWLLSTKSHPAYSSNHRLAIIVPFRDRFEELLIFVPCLSRFIQAQGVNGHIYIVNQSRKFRFNRGALANVGFLVARNSSDYLAIHDVDLLPMNQNLSYAYPSQGPYHLSSPEYHPNYNYSTYFGGILLMTNDHFNLVNGFSNRYFGWGLEDDEFYTRVIDANLTVHRPTGLSTSKRDTLRHINQNRKRDSFRTKEHRDILRRRDRSSGLDNLRYQVSSTQSISIDGHHCSVINVELDCDIKSTPWCRYRTSKGASEEPSNQT